MKKLLTSLIIIVAVGGLVGVLLVGYLGFVPGLSHWLGSDKPRDLGVKYSTEMIDQAQEKTGVEVVQLPDSTSVEASIQLSGQKEVNYSLTSQELTALANRSWKYFPISQVQLKINSDGSVEGSGVVDINKISAYSKAVGFSVETAEKTIDDYKIPRMVIPFYFKFTGNAKDNQVNLQPQALEVGRLGIPGGVLSENARKLSEFLSISISRSPGFSIKTLTFSDGKMNFEGTVPEKEMIVYPFN